MKKNTYLSLGIALAFGIVGQLQAQKKEDGSYHVKVKTIENGETSVQEGYFNSIEEAKKEFKELEGVHLMDGNDFSMHLDTPEEDGKHSKKHIQLIEMNAEFDGKDLRTVEVEEVDGKKVIKINGKEVTGEELAQHGELIVVKKGNEDHKVIEIRDDKDGDVHVYKMEEKDGKNVYFINDKEVSEEEFLQETQSRNIDIDGKNDHFMIHEGEVEVEVEQIDGKKVIQINGEEVTIEDIDEDGMRWKTEDGKEIKILSRKGEDESLDKEVEVMVDKLHDGSENKKTIEVTIEKGENGEEEKLVEVTVIKEITSEVNITDFNAGELDEFGLNDDGALRLNGLNYYPNPSKGSFTLSFENENKHVTDIRVFSLDGKTVYQEKIDDESPKVERQIDLAGAKTGMYVLKISQGDKSLSKKVIIE